MKMSLRDISKRIQGLLAEHAVWHGTTAAVLITGLAISQLVAAEEHGTPSHVGPTHHTTSTHVAMYPPQHHIVVAQNKSSDPKPGTGANRKEAERRIIIERVEKNDRGPGAARTEVPWLGVGTEEISEALAAQLSLNSGEGLVVTLVAPDSPASKAGLKKHDVLTELDNQLLVHPAQLRKLVQSRKAGDKVRLAFIRGSKRETVEATLDKTETRFGFFGDERAWHGDLKQLGPALREEMKALDESLRKSGIDHKSLNIEIRRSAEEARRALEKALRESTSGLRSLGSSRKALEDLARSGVNIAEDATVTVRSHNNEVRTAVKTDEAGTYVIVAAPRKRLTAHDKEGKLLFDGEIETSEQQKLVPAELWDKVSPLLKELNAAEGLKAEDDPKDPTDEKS